MSDIQPRVVVEPTEALVDEVVSVRLERFEPHSEIELRARTTDEKGMSWESRAIFVADDIGSVDLGSQAPREGSWTSVSAMGFIWSMTLDESPARRRYEQHELEPARVTLEATVAGRLVASAELKRMFVGPGVVRTDIDQEGLVGTLYQPPEAVRGDRAAVLVLGGSLGGLENGRAAVLASHGHPALSLAYFGMESLPDALVGIEIEYFEAAIRFMIDRDIARSGHLALMGTSRGGELVLLLASRSPDVGGVVAYVPSGVVHYGIPMGGDRQRIEAGGDPTYRPPAWTIGGEGITGAPVRFDRVDFTDTPVRLCPGFMGGLEDDVGVEAARIPLGHVTAPVIMFSTGDDQVWPSPALARIAEKGLTSSAQVEHIVYDDAGHNIGHPYMPSSTHSYVHPLSHLELALGGTDAGDAHANADSWRRVLEFLSRI